MTDAKLSIDAEEWRDVAGYEASYQVSNLGRIRSKDRDCPVNGGIRRRPGALMRPSLNHYGYYHVHLYRMGKGKCVSLHQLVAWAFLGPQPEGLLINHKDGNKLNNTPENFEYVTNAENIQHACDTGLIDNRRRNKTCVFTDDQVREIRTRLKNGVSPLYLARSYNYTRIGIDKIGRRERYAWVV